MKMLKTVAICFCFAIIPVKGERIMTQSDVIAPSGLRFLKPLMQYSSSVIFPGYLPDTSILRASAGFLDKQRKTDFLWHPLTAYDADNGLGGLAPYVSLERAFAGVRSGLYLGNFHTGSRVHNATEPRDTIKNFEKKDVALNGALWILPPIRYIQGISLWAEGNSRQRTVHAANTDSWKRLHTHYDFQREYGKAVVTCGASFFENDYWSVRAGYAQNHVDAREIQLDTLHFSHGGNYINSLNLLDSSFQMTNASLAIGHTFHFEQLRMHAGILLGGDRTRLDLGSTIRDSSRFFVKAYGEKLISAQKLVLIAGYNLTYSGTLYNQSGHVLSYRRLAEQFNTGKMAHALKARLPLFGSVAIGKKLDGMAGVEAVFDYRSSNYNFAAGLPADYVHSDFRVNLYPLNVRFKPNEGLAVSVSPRLDDEIFFGSLQLDYTLLR